MGTSGQSAFDDARLRVMQTYNAAAEYYDAPACGFWARAGRHTVERLSPAAGARVLDVACGSGASALAAAEAVGPEGSVLGIDLADRLLDLARAKAQVLGLGNTEFRVGDMTETGLADGSFDAVVCVLGIFFVPSMERQMAELWRMTRPGGGKLAITSWGPRVFAPAYDVFREHVRELRPDLDAVSHPWERISTPEALRQLFEDGGARPPEVAAENGWQLLKQPQDFWTMVLGSGVRRTLERLGPENSERVRDAVLDWVLRNGVDRVETNFLYAAAERV
jgi:ubiquinone/menaquinone biosynthesis C-methylase UbiE